MELNPIKVQQYALEKGISFEDAGKELGLNPELVEDMRAGLNNSANWGNIGDKPEFSHKNNQNKPNEQEEEKSTFAKNLVPIGSLVAGIAGAGLLATGVGSGFGVALLGAAAAGLLSSCSNGIDVDQEVQVTVKTDQSAILAAMQKGFDELLKEIQKQGATLDEVIKILVQQNTNLKTIADELKAQGETQKEILQILTNLNNTVTTISNLTNKISNDVEVNGESVKEQLNEILKALKNNNLKVADLSDQLQNLQDLLNEVLVNQEISISLQGDQYKTTQDILNKLNDIKFADENTQLAALLEILNEIKGITTNIDNKLGDIQNTVNDIKNNIPNNDKIEAALQKIMEMLQKNNDKADITNSLLQKLLCMYNGNGSGGGCGITQEDFAKLLELVAANGDKLTNIEKLLADIQKQDADFQKTILQALATLGVEITTQLKDIIANMPDTTNIEAALNKIIDIVNKNGDKADVTNSLLQKLINMYNGGGNGSGGGCGITQEDFAKLLELVAANGDKIDKTNNLLTCIQNQDAKFQKAVLEALAELGGTTYETKDLVNKILNKFNNLSVGGGTVDLSNVEALLNLILQAVKDNGGKLDGIAQQNETLICILNSFKQNVEKALNDIKNAIGDIKGDVTEVKGFLGDVNAKLTEILNRIGNGESCNMDFDALMAKLNDILAAIKDHKVTVDVTGKVTCECCCGSGTHEGVLDDLDNILG